MCNVRLIIERKGHYWMVLVIIESSSKKCFVIVANACVHVDAKQKVIIIVITCIILSYIEICVGHGFTIFTFTCTAYFVNGSHLG